MSFPAGFISGVADILQELNIDEGVIKEILGNLDGAAESMPDADLLKPVPSGAFSALPAGVQMGRHSNNARDYLAGALSEMMKTLGLYREGVVAFQQGNVTHDEFSADELRRIQHATEQASRINLEDSRKGGGH